MLLWALVMVWLWIAEFLQATPLQTWLLAMVVCSFGLASCTFSLLWRANNLLTSSDKSEKGMQLTLAKHALDVLPGGQSFWVPGPPPRWIAEFLQATPLQTWLLAMVVCSFGLASCTFSLLWRANNLLTSSDKSDKGMQLTLAKHVH